MMVAVRAFAVVLAAATNSTMPSPVPLVGVLNVIQFAAVVIDQLQLVVKLKSIVSPAGEAIALCALRLNMQIAPACVTEKVCPAIVNVPLRELMELFALTVYPTVPAPVPGEPKETVIQGTLLVAVREHAGELAAMVIRPFPPPELKEALDGEMEKEHWAARGRTNAHNAAARTARRTTTLNMILRLSRRKSNLLKTRKASFCCGGYGVLWKN